MRRNLRRILISVLSIMVVMGMSAAVFADEPSGDSAANSTIKLTVENQFNMFKPTAATLVTTDEGMTLEVTYTSASYDKMYIGTGKEAVVIADPAKTVSKSAEGKYILPIEKTDEVFYVAAHSVKNEGWYDRTFLIDTANKKLITDNPGTAIVPDDYADEWDETISVDSSVGMFQIEKSKVTIEDDGTATIKLAAGNPSRSFPKFALIEQTASIEEKEANAIIGVDTGKDNIFIYEFSVPVDRLGDEINISHYQVRNGKAEWHDWSEQKTITINSAEVVNQLIEKIQVQKNDEFTNTYMAAAAKCWKALDEEEQLEDDGYFSLDTGDASADDPLNTVPDKDKELLVVSFGTSFNESRAEDIGGVEKALAAAYPDYAVRRAFTAQIIINHVQARDGVAIDNVDQALAKAKEAGVKELIVQPTHLMHGAEYDELVEAVNKVTGIDSITIAEPLLGKVGAAGTDVNADKKAAAEAMVAEAVTEAKADSLDALKQEKTAIVFMGHGTSHDASITYTQMQAQMTELGYDNVFVGTVEGIPEATALPQVKKAVEDAGYTKVILRPMMVVAGDHANNDMADTETGSGSWYDGFANGGEFEVEGSDEPVNIGEGFGADNVTCQIAGLGRIQAIQQIYVQHTQAAVTEAANLETAKEAIAAAKADPTNKELVEAALEAIDKLTDEQKTTLAEDIQSINDAKAAIDKAEQEAADQAEAAKIKAMKISLKSAKAGKKKITVTWKKNTSVAGYQVYYKTGKKAKTVKITKNSTTKKVIKKLKKGKKYTVKVRGYKKIGNQMVYTKWSKVKKVKVK